MKDLHSALPLFYPLVSMGGALLVGLFSLLLVPEDEPKKREDGLTFAGALLAVSATSIQFDTSKTRDRTEPLYGTKEGHPNRPEK